MAALAAAHRAGLPHQRRVDVQAGIRRLDLSRQDRLWLQGDRVQHIVAMASLTIFVLLGH